MVSVSKAFRKVKFDNCTKFIKKLIPPLERNTHKGQNGRIAVIGGSPDYTGAPYYAAQSSLKFGADLSYVFCSKQSIIPIKSYSPEFMVSSFYDADNLVDDSHYNAAVSIVVDAFPRIHTIVIGPGLGRDKHVLNIVSLIISKSIEANIPLVIDADGLFLLSQNINLIKNYQNCILTPNKMEFEKLVTSAINELASQQQDSIILSNLQSDNTYLKLQALCQYLGGITVLLKGASDMVSCGEDVLIIDEVGSPRRCGGQGDILAGSLGAAMYWAIKLEANLLLDSFDDIKDQEIVTHPSPSSSTFTATGITDPAAHTCLESSPSSPPHENSSVLSSTTPPSPPSQRRNKNIFIWASILAATITKRASRLAFSRKGRSMTSPDVMECLGEVFDSSIDHLLTADSDCHSDCH